MPYLWMGSEHRYPAGFFLRWVRQQFHRAFRIIGTNVDKPSSYQLGVSRAEYHQLEPDLSQKLCKESQHRKLPPCRRAAGRLCLCLCMCEQCENTLVTAR